MEEQPYTNRELKGKFDDVHEKLDRILVQTTVTNGRVGKLETRLLIIACVVGTLFAVNTKELIGFVMSIL